ncbi:hypothetical protein D5086_001839 [Populus alba]|uniref:Uncharacterized protein n=3 Tax=Populus TaxID=3689 RepID=A0ACC4D0Q2_POPAL|nr:hypothetical protein NC653_002241 [Populus alba x Populus x berolinensis]
MPQGEPSMDPICDEVTRVVDSWVEVQGRKKVKPADSVPVITSLSSPICASSNIVHHDITMVENKDANKCRGYGFKSRVASKIMERPEDSDPPTPSL